MYLKLRQSPIHEKTIICNSNKIWIIGDSRVSQWEYKKPLELEHLNLGIPEQTSAQVYYRLCDYLLRNKPEILILEIGVNDLKFRNKDSLRLNYTIDNIKNILLLLKNNNVIPVFLSIIPSNNNPSFFRFFYWNYGLNDDINIVNTKIQYFCSKNAILYIDLNKVLFSDKHSNLKLYDDCLHINIEAYALLNTMIKKEIYNLR